jgi:diacylglycerol kinase (ATP)
LPLNAGTSFQECLPVTSIEEEVQQMHLRVKAGRLTDQTMEKTISAFKKATILHNPGAGEGDTSRKELLHAMELAGFECSYSSTKQFGWENMDTADTDFLVLAGGDGTVRKIAEEMLSRKLIEKKLPLGLLPMGTANNIAKTLGLCAKIDDIVAGWRKGVIKKFDVGVIKGPGREGFFLESFGYGLFPRLMREMKKQKKNDIEDSRERLQAALQLLGELTESAPVRKCRLEIDGQDHSGEYILVEVMNTRSIGPNVMLVPQADPGDGKLEVIAVRDDERQKLIDYVNQRLKGIDARCEFPALEAREKLVILWDGKHMHVDDDFDKIDKAERMDVQIRRGLLDFLVPDLPADFCGIKF